MSSRPSRPVRSLSRTFLLCAAVAAVAVGIHAAPGPNTPDESAAIKAARARQNAAIADFNLDEVVRFWTDDVTICRGLGLQSAGKDAYRKSFAASPPSPSRIVYRRETTLVEVSAHWPLAFESGVYHGHLGGWTGPSSFPGATRRSGSSATAPG